MSAYIVDKNHIVYLISAALSRRLNGAHSSFSWCAKNPEAEYGYDRKQLLPGDYDRAAEVANMLWLENMASVSARYPNESSATLPGPGNGEFYVVTPDDIRPSLWDSIDPVQVLKACDCYEYQSCEHDGWEASESRIFIQALRKAAWQHIPGYEEAEWGAGKTLAEKTAEARKLLKR